MLTFSVWWFRLRLEGRHNLQGWQWLFIVSITISSSYGVVARPREVTNPGTSPSDRRHLHHRRCYLLPGHVPQVAQPTRFLLPHPALQRTGLAHPPATRSDRRPCQGPGPADSELGRVQAHRKSPPPQNKTHGDAARDHTTSRSPIRVCVANQQNNIIKLLVHELEAVLPHHHPPLRSRSVLDVRCLRPLLGDGHGVREARGERAVLRRGIPSLADEPAVWLYLVSAVGWFLHHCLVRVCAFVCVLVD